ncbi:MAG: DNA adenine methylase [Polyangiaceae bacterium]|nr:DNA adenine methylase [Polyangiaceae bacterium]
MGLHLIDACPPYFGGKRKLLGEIFRDLPKPEDHDRELVFADCFLGGGSVSLFAKARGYRVMCNDIAERSVAVGKGLVENNGVTLSRHDLLKLFTDPPEPSTFCVDHLAPEVVITKHAEALDRVMAWARATPGTKGWLLRLLAVRYLLAQRPMGNFGARTITRQVEDGDWDEVNPHYLKDCAERMVSTSTISRIQPSRQPGCLTGTGTRGTPGRLDQKARRQHQVLRRAIWRHPRLRQEPAPAGRDAGRRAHPKPRGQPLLQGRLPRLARGGLRRRRAHPRLGHHLWRSHHGPPGARRPRGQVPLPRPGQGQGLRPPRRARQRHEQGQERRVAPHGLEMTVQRLDLRACPWDRDPF